MGNFKEKTLKEIKLWAWAAAVLPISALAGIFFIWWFGTKEMFSIALVVGETAMFATAAVWWWWALRVIKTLIAQWEYTRENVHEVLHEVKEVRAIVTQTMADKDK